MDKSKGGKNILKNCIMICIRMLVVLRKTERTEVTQKDKDDSIIRNEFDKSLTELCKKKEQGLDNLTSELMKNYISFMN